MKKMQTVSVIIPAYNAEQSLSECIDSVLAQSYKSFEIFVIDDGSTDNTKQIAESYGDAITFLEQTNQGQGAARNLGLKTSHGDYVAFLDADDYWLESFLEHCTSFLLNNPDVVAVNTGQITKMLDNTEQIGPAYSRNRENSQEAFILDNFFEFWAEQDHVRTGSALIRRDVIEKSGYQRADLRVSQDLEYWGYIATFGKWGFIPAPLWVGNSRAVAVKGGWLNKYKKRRKLCPTVESWEERLKPLLKDDAIRGFRVVRGRVASGYTQYMILAGRHSEARNTFKKYSKNMPRNRMTLLMSTANRFGAPGWWLACRIVRAKEFYKVFRLNQMSKSAN